MNRLLIIFIIVFLIFLFFIFKNKSKVNKIRKIYYLENNPTEVVAKNALQYLKENPEIYVDKIDDIIIQGTSLETIENDLQKDYDNGLRNVVTLFGTQALSKTIDWMSKHKDFTMLNVYSTAMIDKPDNILRFPLNDSNVIDLVTQKIPKDTVVFYDEDNLWASTNATLFKEKGFTITNKPPSTANVLILATIKTPEFINELSSSTKKVYGLDGSVFYPFEGVEAQKASRLMFECITYEPTVISKLLNQTEKAINEDISYIYPVGLDALKYQDYLNKGVSRDVIESSSVGFTGNLELENGDRKYGDFAWYIFRQDKGWVLVQKIIIDEKGTCTINV